MMHLFVESEWVTAATGEIQNNDTSPYRYQMLPGFALGEFKIGAEISLRFGFIGGGSNTAAIAAPITVSALRSNSKSHKNIPDSSV
jgi:hypothetical protein